MGVWVCGCVFNYSKMRKNKQISQHKRHTYTLNFQSLIQPPPSPPPPQMFNEAIAARIVRQICLALSYIHKMGIVHRWRRERGREGRGRESQWKNFLCTCDVYLTRLTHRDLKPENILLDHSDLMTAKVKITDFGLSKIMKGTSTFPCAFDFIYLPFFY